MNASNASDQMFKELKAIENTLNYLTAELNRYLTGSRYAQQYYIVDEAKLLHESASKLLAYAEETDSWKIS